jgi:alkyl hydroperoxide reductase subunit D
MKLENLLNQLPEYSKDIKINMQNLINENNQYLHIKQLIGCFLACSLTTKNQKLIDVAKNEALAILSENEINAIKIASTLMSMTNIYYRFTHIIDDNEYLQMQTGLRMRMLIEHKIDKVDFEIYCLAVSIINGCKTCIDAHTHQLRNSGLNKTQIQMIAKISAVIHALAQVLIIEN